jgi:FtsP/CotA-like multicopper oxidase with cupredoxin domain
LRLINAANARILRLKLEGAQVGLIGMDGYYCEPFPLDERRAELMTAQRMGVLVDTGSEVFKLQVVSTNHTLTAVSFIPDVTTHFLSQDLHCAYNRCLCLSWF